MKIFAKKGFMTIYECEDEKEAAEKIGEYLISKVVSNPKINLGFCSGKTLIPVYKYLSTHRKKPKVNYRKVNFFNLQEFIFTKNEDDTITTFKAYISELLYKNIKAKKKNIHFPTDNIQLNDFSWYDRVIWSMGGIEILTMPIGGNGHIGFNEPGADPISLTHIEKLNDYSKGVFADEFKNKVKSIPQYGVTAGVTTIMNAREIVLLVTGIRKLPALIKLYKGQIDKEWPCTYLAKHHNIKVFIDEVLANALRKLVK